MLYLMFIGQYSRVIAQWHVTCCVNEVQEGEGGGGEDAITVDI